MEHLDSYLKKNKAIIEINSLEECIKLFSGFGKIDSDFRYFRGHIDSSYMLKSTLDRLGDNESGQKEKLLLRQFKKTARNYLSGKKIPRSTFEWLSVMQHYGAPTRLLDVTSSPFIALYFAVKDFDKDNGTDGAVWVFNPLLIHEGSLLKLEQSKFPFEIDRCPHFHQPSFITDKYFEETFLSGKYRVCFILEPEISEKRLSQQQGAFLVSSGLGVSTDEILQEVMFDLIEEKSYKYGGGSERGFWDWHIVKVIIPHSLKKGIFRQLQSMNINSATLFPDISGLAMHVEEYVRISNVIGNRWNFRLKPEKLSK